MKLRYQLNLFTTLILVMVSFSIASIGVIAINHVTRELNSRLLAHDVQSLIHNIRDAKEILQENRVNTLESYVERAKIDLLDEFRQFKFGKTGQLLIIDSTLKKDLLLGSHNGLKLDPSCIDSLIERKHGEGLCVIGSQNYFISFLPEEEWQWIVVIVVAYNEIMAARNQFLWRVGYILISSLCIGIFVFFWFTGKIISPIKQLTTAAANVAQGKWDVELPNLSGNNEIVDLATIFKKMSRNLSESYHQLQDNLQKIADSREELRISREQFKGLVETSSDLVWEVDKTGAYTYISPRVETMLGYKAEELLGCNADKLTAERCSDASNCYSELLLKDVPFSTVERRVVTKNGDIQILESSGRPFHDSDGIRQGFRGIDRNITERVRAIEIQKELEDQLIQAQKMESIGRLAGGVAHDYNNMLSVIIGNVEMALLNPNLPSTCSSYFVEIQKAAERSAQITKQLLAFARKQPVNPVEIDLNKAIYELLKMLRRLIGENIELLLQPDDDIRPILLDGSQLDQIMVNLCVNSRDAIENNGTITIRTQNIELDEEFCQHHNKVNPGQFVLLEVADTGKGIDKELLEKIFEPFFTTKELGKGTGLGLATVYGIIQQNHGIIDVKSSVGEGTSFMLYFPVSEGKEKKKTKSVDTVKPVPGKGSVLLVEDENLVLKLTSHMLSSLGYTVIESQTAKEALFQSHAKGKEIGLLITDVIMPDMNGYDLMKKICAENPHIQCLFISGYPADGIAHHGVLDPDVNFLQKPYSREELLLKINEILEK